MNTKPSQNEVWIGLVEVTPLPGNQLLGTAKGAFVHVLAWASSPVDYRRVVCSALELNGFAVLGDDGVWQFSAWQRSGEPSASLRQRAIEVKDSHEVRCDEFYVYEKQSDRAE